MRFRRCFLTTDRNRSRAIAMDYAEAIHLPTSRTFWNSHDPTLDHPFDEALVPTMAPLEGSNCSSSFLFPSTSSACDTGSGSPACKRPFQQSIFEENLTLEGGDGASESIGATAQSNCTITPAGSMDSSQFSWLLASPHHHAQGVSASQAQIPESGANAPPNHQVPGFFGALSSSSPVGSATSSAPDFGHGAGFPSFAKPLMRQPSFRRPYSSLHLVTKQLNAKASWQSAMAQTHATSFNHRNLSPKDQGPLDSPCSVVSGFTKLLQGADPAFPDFDMESFGPSTSAGQDKVLRFLPSQDPLIGDGSAHVTQSLSGTRVVRPCKRKRSKGPKQGDEVESQRRTHIAVERNRRKQMNEHLAALRALMPGSYVQKGDQASIVGGAIEFVKELEHLLNCLQSQKRRRAYSDLSKTPTSRPAILPILDQLCPIAQQPFSFHSPQRVVEQSSFLLGSSTDGGSLTRHPQTSAGMMYTGNQMPIFPQVGPAATVMGVAEVVGEAKSEMASVEVKRVGAEQALVNIMAPRRSGQLLRTVVALESLALTVMHTNITTVRHTVLYSFHVQLELACRMSVDELAAALHHSFTSLHSLQF